MAGSKILKKFSEDLQNHVFYTLFIFFFLSPVVFSLAGNSRIDSLMSLLRSGARDTSKVNALNDLSWELRLNDPDTAIILSSEALKLAKTLTEKFGYQCKLSVGNSLIDLAVYYWQKADHKKSLDYYQEAMALYNSFPASDDHRKIKTAIIFGNIGLIFHNTGNYPAALENYFRSLLIYEELARSKNDHIASEGRTGIARDLGNIGGVYYMQANFDLALEYFIKTLKRNEEIGNKQGIAIWMGNVGLVHMEKKNYTEALDCFTKASKLNMELSNKDGFADDLCNIGIVFMEQSIIANVGSKKDSLSNMALINYSQALSIYETIDNKNGALTDLSNMGILYYLEKKYMRSRDIMNRSLQLSQEIKDLVGFKISYFYLSKLDSISGNWNGAYEHFKKFIIYRDSILNESNTRKQTQTEMQYEFDKEQVTDSIRNSEFIKQENLKHDHEIQQQRAYTLGGAFGFILMLIVAGVSFRAYRNKQKANEIISRQKALVEEKQKEILDSIHYAKRIQKSLLPTNKYINSKLKKL